MDDFLTNINLKKNLLTKNELKACEAIVENLVYVQKYSFTELSEIIGISKASILRFCKKIGYSGYNEFKFDCIKYVNSLYNINESEENHKSKISKITSLYSNVFSLIDKTVNEDEIINLIQLMKKARKIYALGIVNSAVICHQLRYAFLMYGICIEVVSSLDELQTLDLTLNENDLFIIISVSSKTDIVKMAFKLKENIGLKTCLITMNTQTPLIKQSDITIILPPVSNLKNQSLLDSIPTYTVFVEILLYYYSHS